MGPKWLSSLLDFFFLDGTWKKFSTRLGNRTCRNLWGLNQCCQNKEWKSVLPELKGISQCCQNEGTDSLLPEYGTEISDVRVHDRHKVVSPIKTKSSLTRTRTEVTTSPKQEMGSRFCQNQGLGVMVTTATWLPKQGMVIDLPRHPDNL